MKTRFAELGTGKCELGLTLCPRAAVPSSGFRVPRLGFTLVELLAVIAIIVLLMGILVPSVNSARRQAKRARTSAQLDAIGKGCEMFNNEMKRYPKSYGGNPFESSSYGGSGGPSVFLSGAQWLLLELAGPDLRGFVRPDTANDTNNDGKIDHVDWLEWYSLTPRKQYGRVGPYVSVDGQITQSVETYPRVNGSAGTPPASLTAGSSVWNNARAPFFVDGFNFPILYYAANAAEKTNAVWRNRQTPGQYDQTDNAAFTGSEADKGRNTNAEPGWDLAGQNQPHPYKTHGFTDPTTEPPQESFTGQIYDRAIFKATQQGARGRVWPHRADTFILITPGPDGLFGNEDDIRNFEVSR